MIVTGGENVYCGEVEAVILAHPAIREVAVFGIPDPQWGELVAATGSGLVQFVTSITSHQQISGYRPLQ